MKTTVKIHKNRLEPPIDFSEVIESRRVGDIGLEYNEFDFIQFESNRLIVFDAYSASHKYKPFDTALGIVAFPFYLGCMTDAGERVAYCGLRFGEGKVAEWRLLFPDERNSVLAKLAVDADAASVPISSGVCCISDERAYKKFVAHIGEDSHPLSGIIVLNGQTHTAVSLYGSKYAVFSSGWGDGRYKCYAGYDKDNKPMALIVDFGMIEYPKTDNGFIETEIETRVPYVYDPQKSDSDNNIDRWTAALEYASTPVERLVAYSRRGYTYHSRNELDKALADYIAAAHECKSVTDRGALLRAWPVFDNAASLFVQKSDLASAIELMNDALSIRDHFYVGAYVRLIDLYQLTKNNEKAVEIAERMIKSRPDDPVSNMKYAEVCVSVMEYAKAARTYHRLASEFHLYENYFDQASCMIELGDYDGADVALESHPSKEYNEQYWYYKAYIDYKKRRYREALVKAEKSHSIDAEYMPALYLLIDIESVTQEYHAVARYAEEYKKLRPDGEYGYCVCAEAQLILGNYSECSRNYYHLYDKIKADDKYAALAAITAARMGDQSRKAVILRKLRRKRSAYYSGAVYAIYIKQHTNHDASLSKAVYKMRTDDDFMLQLAVYLTGTGNFASASHLLRTLTRTEKPSFEVVAQQIRLASKLNDKKLFNSFFEYYVNTFFGADITDDDKAKLSEKFRGDD